MKNTNSERKIIDLLLKLNTLDIVKNSFAYEEFNKVSERLKDNRFKLAVVGEFSSGKSTFLNCLLKQDLLKHGRTETTATLTEIENVINEEDAGFFDVYYLNGKQEFHVPLNELEDFTSTSSKKHKVASEVERVVIKSKIIDTEDEICFVDTPGLNGVADKHREKTIDEIRKAHACIYLLPIRGLGKTDYEFIKYISKYQKNIIFIQNFIDELDALENETPEEKIEEQKKLLYEQKLFSEDDNINLSFAAISSLKALVSLDKKTFSKFDGILLDDCYRKKLYEESRIKDVYNLIDGIIAKNQTEAFQKKEAVLVAIRIIDQIIEIVEFQKTQFDNELINLLDAKKMNFMQQKTLFLKEHKAEYLDNIVNYIEISSEDIRRLGFNQIDECLDEILENLEDLLDSEKNLEDLLSLIDGPRLNNFINSYIQNLEQKNEELCSIHYENLIRNTVLHIQEYTSNKIGHINDIFINSAKSIERVELKSFDIQEKEIERLELELNEKKSELENLMDKQKRYPSELKDLQNEVNEKKQELEDVLLRKQQEISKLGEQPSVDIKTRYVDKTVERKGGIFGKIVTFFVGEKIETVEEAYKDFSKQDDWKRNRSAIDTKYSEKQIELEKEKNLLETRLRNYEKDSENVIELSSEKRKEIEIVKRLLDSKLELLKTEKEKAKYEYMRTIKNEVINQINCYLFEELDINVIIKDEFKKACNKNKEAVKNICVSLFETSYSLRINEMENLISSNKNTINNNIQNLLIELKQYKTVMEDFVYGRD